MLDFSSHSYRFKWKVEHWLAFYWHVMPGCWLITKKRQLLHTLESAVVRRTLAPGLKALLFLFFSFKKLDFSILFQRWKHIVSSCGYFWYSQVGFVLLILSLFYETTTPLCHYHPSKWLTRLLQTSQVVFYLRDLVVAVYWMYLWGNLICDN